MEDMCIRCGTCCKLIPVDSEKMLLLRDGLKDIDLAFYESLIPVSIEEARLVNESYVENVQNIFPNASFFRCKYLGADNLCSTFDKDDSCQAFPSHPLALVPDECGYYGEFFIQSEEIKQKVRKYKEEVIYYEAMIASGCKEEKVYHKIIDSLNRFIDKYAPYGSYDW